MVTRALVRPAPVVPPDAQEAREERSPRRRLSLVAVLVVAVGLLLGGMVVGDEARHLAEQRAELATATARIEQLRRALGVAEGSPGALRVAAHSTVRLLEDNAAAMNAMDVEALRATYAADAVLADLIAERVTHGADAIAVSYGQIEDFGFRRTTGVVLLEGYAVHGFVYDAPASGGRSRGVAFVRIRNGKIAEHVLIGD